VAEKAKDSNEKPLPQESAESMGTFFWILGRAAAGRPRPSPLPFPGFVIGHSPD